MISKCFWRKFQIVLSVFFWGCGQINYTASVFFSSSFKQNKFLIKCGMGRGLNFSNFLVNFITTLDKLIGFVSHYVVVGSLFFGVRQTCFLTQSCFIWPWINYLTSTSLSSLISQNGIVAPSYNCMRIKRDHSGKVLSMVSSTSCRCCINNLFFLLLLFVIIFIIFLLLFPVFFFVSHQVWHFLKHDLRCCSCWILRIYWGYYKKLIGWENCPLEIFETQKTREVGEQ